MLSVWRPRRQDRTVLTCCVARAAPLTIANGTLEPSSRPPILAPGTGVPGQEIDMAPRRQWLFSTVATKVLVALTGLSLIGFLCVHLAGNLLLYLGPAKFNAYSHALISNLSSSRSNSACWPFFVTHVLQAVTNWWSDRGARPIAYQVKRGAGGRSRKSAASEHDDLTGSVMFVFVAVHIATMKYGAWYPQSSTRRGRDLYRLVREVFGTPRWVVSSRRACGHPVSTCGTGSPARRIPGS